MDPFKYRSPIQMKNPRSYILYSSTETAYKGSQPIKSPSGRTIHIRVEESHAGLVVALDQAKLRANETVLNTIPVDNAKL